MPELSDKSQNKNDQIGSGIEKRRSRWLGSYEALKYVSRLSRKDFRYSDKVTDILAGIAICIFALLFFVPINLFRLPLALLCDSLFSVTIIFFIANRFGVLSSLSERQAVLVWDIILGTLLLGVLLTVNVALVIGLVQQMPHMF